MTKETREVLNIVNAEAERRQQIWEQKHDQLPPPPIEESEPEAPQFTKKQFMIASLIIVIPIIYNGYILWDHVFRTLHQAIIGNDAAFPTGWERFDAVQILYRTLFLGAFIAMYVYLKYAYTQEHRRCDYGV